MFLSFDRRCKFDVKTHFREASMHPLAGEPAALCTPQNAHLRLRKPVLPQQRPRADGRTDVGTGALRAPAVFPAAQRGLRGM